MGTPVILKIILPDGTPQRLTFPNGLPSSVDNLMIEVQEQCGLHGDFRLQFMATLFDYEFLNLTTMSEVENKGTLRLIHMSRPSTSQDERFGVEMGPQSPQSPGHSSVRSTSTVDTDVMSSPESRSSRSSWPAVFKVPEFTYDAEIKLQRGNSAFQTNGTLLFPDPKLKSSILQGLVQEIVQYKMYVNDREIEQVAKSLIQKHPCLADKASPNGCGGWKNSLKYKMSNYRSDLRRLGCPEVTVNSLQNKPTDRRTAAFGVNRPKRAEVNFCPQYPSAETETSMESLRASLLLDVKRRNGQEDVRVKMDRTFAHRRHEVVRDAPSVDTLMARWPALFDVREINAEFKRITTMPLQSKVLSQLDVYSGDLSRLFERRGGQLGERLKGIVAELAHCDDVDAGRECIIKGLCIYLNEAPENLIRE
ncbi:uncharacterized protein LOC134443429 [Engraulis encrasicolus]|uniref:uncharacterized protein LOC134443429 n=1 Tax=Engraulis encrasicolus TaxID=184585 RepID=UPI002FD4DBFD